MNNDTNFALYVALTELARISEDLDAIKMRDYDGELAEFTSVMDDRIEFVFSIAKENANDVFHNYVDQVGYELAEANHP
jgi:hypothetical protein